MRRRETLVGCLYRRGVEMAFTGILGACMCIDGAGYGVGMVEHRRPAGEGGGTKSKGGLFSGAWCGGGRGLRLVPRPGAAAGGPRTPYSKGGWWRAWGERQGIAGFAIERVGLRGVA